MENRDLYLILQKIEMAMKKLLLSTLLMLGFALTASAQLPAVTLKSIDGKTVKTDTLSNNGKPFIIDFFATWCKPCNRELTAISEVYEEWQEETGVKVFAVSIDQAQNINKVKPLVDNHGWTFDVRANLQKGGFSLLAEYAQKTDDPTTDKNFPYIYRKGYVAMLSTSYSKKGMSLLLQAKRSDNMTFRSLRKDNGTASYINHLPAFAMQQTYTLAALYPYATQPNGEWAYQAELGYKFKRHTFLGGKYGTGVKLNFSHIHAIERNVKDGGTPGTEGYGSAFWKWGDQTYYQDINIQVEKKFSKSFNLNLMYMNQFYNKAVVESHGDFIHSDIFVAEGKYRFNKKVTLRGEAQYLHTKQDQGDWWFGLLELSVMPHFMFTISDQYNANEYYYTSTGTIDAERGTHKEHYFAGSVTYTHGAHRLQIGYGKTRAGYNCSGGVCRYVPASKGVTMSYNFNF